MMRHLNIQMNTTVDRERLLATLRENRGRHGKIVKEARESYVCKAEEALKERLAQIAKGKIVGLEFRLTPPQDFTEAYDTAIQMLEWTEDKTITLSAGEFRKLVMDEWDWLSDFLLSNSGHSRVAAEYAASKGLL